MFIWSNHFLIFPFIRLCIPLECVSPWLNSIQLHFRLITPDWLSSADCPWALSDGPFRPTGLCRSASLSLFVSLSLFLSLYLSPFFLALYLSLFTALTANKTHRQPSWGDADKLQSTFSLITSGPISAGHFPLLPLHFLTRQPALSIRQFGWSSVRPYEGGRGRAVRSDWQLLQTCIQGSGAHSCVRAACGYCRRQKWFNVSAVRNTLCQSANRAKLGCGLMAENAAVSCHFHIPRWVWSRYDLYSFICLFYAIITYWWQCIQKCWSWPF